MDTRKWLNEQMCFAVHESTPEGYRRHFNNYIKPRPGDQRIGFVTTAAVQKMYNDLHKNGRLNESYEKDYSL